MNTIKEIELLMIDDGYILKLFLFFNNKVYKDIGIKIKITSINTLNCRDILEDLNKNFGRNKIIFINAHLKYLDHNFRSDCNGLEILKHIRLTKKLGSNDFKPALLPIIVGIFFPPEYYIRMSPDNIIICSPKCETIFIHDFNEKEFVALVEKLSKAGPFKNYKDMKKQIGDYILFIEKDYNYFTPVGIPTSHDIRNDIGPGILLEELVPTVSENDEIVKKYKNALNTIHGKKISFLEHRFFGTIRTYPLTSLTVLRKKLEELDDEDLKKELKDILNSNNLQELRNELQNLIRNETLNEILKKELNELNDLTEIIVEREEIREKLKNLKFILIDDEYKEGWAYALCFGLFGENPGNIREESFRCFASFKDAEGWFNGICREFEELLKRWAEVDKRLFDEITSNNQQNSSNTIDELKSLRNKLENFFPYDLVFLDLRLEPKDKEKKNPEKFSGMKLLKSIKKFNPGIPVIIFTASEKAEILETALKNGADGYWIKCVDDGMSLIQMIKKLCFWEIESNEIRRYLNRVDVLKRFWIKIKMFEKKHWHWYWEHKKIDEILHLLLPSGRKKEILLLLNKAFNNLIINPFDYNYLGLIMGIIQEWRHWKCNWDYWENKRNHCIPCYDAERDFRSLRNDLIHFQPSSRSPIYFEDIIWAFEFTLDRLLNSIEILESYSERKRNSIEVNIDHS
jgi:CheY-like chemotaxis protein